MAELDEEQPEKREPWELPELKEGFDVYEYDPAQAKRGQRIVIAIFLIAALLFIAYAIVSYRESLRYPLNPQRP